jgi:hypothetical protein
MLTLLLFNMKLGRETLSFWVKAFSEDTAKRLENFGFIQFRAGGKLDNNVYASPWCFFLAFQFFPFYARLVHTADLMSSNFLEFVPDKLFY